MARPHDTLLLNDRLKSAIWQSAMRPLRGPCSARLTYAQACISFQSFSECPGALQSRESVVIEWGYLI